MPKASGPYVVTFQAERFHKTVRYHWMICSAHHPDQLVSWGHAATQELAERAAQNELTELNFGKSRGGRVISKNTTVIRRRSWRVIPGGRH